MKQRLHARRTLCIVLVAAMGLAGCAVPQGGATGQGGSTNTQAGCILGHVAIGAIAGAVLTGALGGNSKAIRTGAVAGGVAGFATAWMTCINQYARATTTQLAPLQAVTEPGYTPQQGTLLRVRSAYLDPSAVSAGGRSTLRVAYLVMDPGRDVTVNQTVSFRFVSPDGTEQAAMPKVDKVVVEPGLHQISLPLDIPPEITDGKLVATIAIEANGRSQTTSHDIVITGDSRRLDMARNEAERQRGEYERLVAAARRTTPASAVQVAAAEPSASANGAKGALSGATRTLVVQIARANLRDQPSAKARLLGTAARGERLRVESDVTGAEGRWLRVTVGSVTGWIGASAGLVE